MRFGSRIWTWVFCIEKKKDNHYENQSRGHHSSWGPYIPLVRVSRVAVANSDVCRCTVHLLDRLAPLPFLEELAIQIVCNSVVTLVKHPSYVTPRAVRNLELLCVALVQRSPQRVRIRRISTPEVCPDPCSLPEQSVAATFWAWTISVICDMKRAPRLTCVAKADSKWERLMELFFENWNFLRKNSEETNGLIDTYTHLVVC